MVEIVETTLDNTTLAIFQKSAEQLYSADSLRLKQKESFNKEYFYCALIALKNNEPIARLVIYNNPHLLYNGSKAVTIGNFESINDQTVAQKLLKTTEQIVKEKLKANFVIGPMNGSTWDNYRFSMHNNFSNFFLEPYHHLYYNDLFVNFGFKPIANYISCLDKKIPHDTPEVLKLQERFKDAGVSLRNIDLTNYETELEKVYELAIEAFKTNFLYTPITLSAFKEKYTAIKQIAKPGFILMAEDASKNLIGFIFCIDDLYNTREKSFIVKTIARKNEKKWSGLGSILVNEVFRKAAKENYTSVVHAFMIEDATSIKLSNSFTGEIYKNYVLYGKGVGTGEH